MPKAFEQAERFLAFTFFGASNVCHTHRAIRPSRAGRECYARCLELRDDLSTWPQIVGMPPPAKEHGEAA